MVLWGCGGAYNLPSWSSTCPWTIPHSLHFNQCSKTGVSELTLSENLKKWVLIWRIMDKKHIFQITLLSPYEVSDMVNVLRIKTNLRCREMKPVSQSHMLLRGRARFNPRCFGSKPKYHQISQRVKAGLKMAVATHQGWPSARSQVAQDYLFSIKVSPCRHLLAFCAFSIISLVLSGKYLASWLLWQKENWRVPDQVRELKWLTRWILFSVSSQWTLAGGWRLFT